MQNENEITKALILILDKKAKELTMLKKSSQRTNLYRIYRDKTVFSTLTTGSYLYSLNIQETLTPEEIAIINEIDLFGIIEYDTKNINNEYIQGITLEINKFKKFIESYEGEYILNIIQEKYPTEFARIDIIEQAFIIAIWESKLVSEVLDSITVAINILIKIYNLQLFKDLKQFTLLARALDSDSEEILKISDYSSYLNMAHYPLKPVLTQLSKTYSNLIKEVEQTNNIQDYLNQIKNISESNSFIKGLDLLGREFCEDLFNLTVLTEYLKGNKTYNNYFILNANKISFEDIATELDKFQLIIKPEVDTQSTPEDILNTLVGYSVINKDVPPIIGYILARILNLEVLLNQLELDLKFFTDKYEEFKKLFNIFFLPIYLAFGNDFPSFFSTKTNHITLLTDRLNTFNNIITKLLNMSDDEYTKLISVKNEQLAKIAKREYPLRQDPLDHLGVISSIFTVAGSLKLGLEEPKDLTETDDQIFNIFELICNLADEVCYAYNLFAIDEKDKIQMTDDESSDAASKYNYLMELFSKLGLIFLSDTEGRIYLSQGYINVTEEYLFGWNI